MNYPSHVRIVEVSPRDGLQNESQIIDVETKLALIDGLVDSGLEHIEVTGFVSPKWIPQLADSQELVGRLPKHEFDRFSALVPNTQGMERAVALGLREVAVFTAASETFNQKNINCSIAESFKRFEPVMEMAREHGIRVRGYVSCALGCPYEGDIPPEKVAEVTEELLNLGCYEISLGDTIGAGTPLKAQQMYEACLIKAPPEELAIHFHDTRGQALANILACMQLGAHVIDASVGGLGGCPYAKGASGNVATEDVVYMLYGMGIETGVNLFKLVETGRKITKALGRNSASKVSSSLP